MTKTENRNQSSKITMDEKSRAAFVKVCNALKPLGKERARRILAAAKIILQVE